MGKQSLENLLEEKEAERGELEVVVVIGAVSASLFRLGSVDRPVSWCGFLRVKGTRRRYSVRFRNRR